MLPADALADDVHKHLSAATLALGDWIALADPRDRYRLMEIARLCTRAQDQLMELTRSRKPQDPTE